jgi:murein DD-endopeptidase MepM/ murein hydrolase activator NlpD
MMRFVVRLVTRRMIVAVGVCVAALILAAGSAFAQQGDGWQTFVSDDAAYAFDYPAGTQLSVSTDAALRFKSVEAQLPITDTSAYQAITVMVLENPANQSLQQFVAAKYAAAGQPAASYAALQVGPAGAARGAIRLERDAVIGNLDKYTVLVPGAGVVYRINLYGGGVGGPVEPSPQTQAVFDRIVSSFRVLDAPLKPGAAAETRAAASADALPVAQVFTYPLRSTASVAYGVPVGIVVAGTRLEWLDYAIRNFDQWGIKCYNVDWARMLHTGEDWYRLDGANTSGSPVVAVADGQVVRADPGISYPGRVILIQHRLADGRIIYSMYGHVTNVSVVQGQMVALGQQIATVLPQGYTGRTPSQHSSYDSHLHFEMRYFLDGTNIYVPGTNAYNYNYPACTYAYPGRGYTYLISPDDYPYPGQGYFDPTDFIAAHLGGPQACQPTELVKNGGF